MSVGHRTGKVWFTSLQRQRKSAPQVRKWANQDSSGTTKRTDSRWLSSRDSKTRVPGRLWQKKYSKVEWNDRVSKRRNLSCSSRRRTTSTRSTTSSWTIIGTKLGSSWSSWEKVLMRWKNWSDFKALHSTQLRGENWSKIKILSLNSLARCRNCRMKSIVWTIREIFKMLNQYAVDSPTLPVNLCLSSTSSSSWRRLAAE